MLRVLVLVLVLVPCFLVRSGWAGTCDWDPDLDPDQGLDPVSLGAGARVLARPAEVPDAARCRALCCACPRCDLALLGLPADGGAQCTLLSCGPGACTLRPSTQFQAFLRRDRDRDRDQDLDQDRDQDLDRDQDQDLRKDQDQDQDRLLGANNDTNHVLCRLPVKVGSCRAAFPRFFYNVTSQSCVSFVYGGCEANGNNFPSQEACMEACGGVSGSFLPEDSTPAPPQPKAPRMAPAQFGPDQDSEMSADEFAERCVAPPEAGPCRAALPRWFFSPTEGCRRFTYGGCRGNRNNHPTQESCEATCSGVSVLPSSKKESGEEPAAGTARCRLGPEPGPCRAAFARFYWDWDSASCRSFLFGGCRGNANNFPSEELCMKGCGGGVAGGRGASRDRWTAAFFLFLTLALVSALFLAALVIVMLRRRLSRHGSSFSDQEELLPEPDELSSLDSLPIPEKVKPGPEA